MDQSNSLFSFRNLKIVDAFMIQDMVLYNNTGKAFLVEDLQVVSEKVFGPDKWQNLYRMKSQFGRKCVFVLRKDLY